MTADATVLEFDTSRRETSVIDCNGDSTTCAYFASGAATGTLLTITDPIGFVTTQPCDNANRVRWRAGRSLARRPRKRSRTALTSASRGIPRGCEAI